MKFLSIVVLLGAGFQSVGEEISLEALLYPMVSTYASEIENCEVADLDIDSLSDIKNICQSLIDSEICSNVKPKYLMDCDKLENQIGHQVFDRTKWPYTSSIDYMKSAWIYNEVETDRLDEETEWSEFVTHFSRFEEEPEFSCLNEKGKRKVWRKYIPPSRVKSVQNTTTTTSYMMVALGVPLMLTGNHAKSYLASQIGYIALGVSVFLAFGSDFGLIKEKRNTKNMDSVKAMNSVRKRKIQ